jgi:hypothetical protein
MLVTTLTVRKHEWEVLPSGQWWADILFHFHGIMLCISLGMGSPMWESLRKCFTLLIDRQCTQLWFTSKLVCLLLSLFWHVSSWSIYQENYIPYFLEYPTQFFRKKRQPKTVVHSIFIYRHCWHWCLWLYDDLPTVLAYLNEASVMRLRSFKVSENPCILKTCEHVFWPLWSQNVKQCS